jgi:hypothetical protein
MVSFQGVGAMGLIVPVMPLCDKAAKLKCIVSPAGQSTHARPQ